MKACLTGLQIKEQQLFGWFSKRGKGERLGTSLNELWPSPIYIIEGILNFIQNNLKRASLKSAL